MPKPTMEGHATMKCPIGSITCKLFYLLYWRERGHIGSDAGLQVDSHLGLGLPIRGPSLQRATLTLVG